MQFVTLGRLSFEEWAGLIRGSRAPFGAAAAEITYRPKDRHVGVRDGDGRLLAALGATVVTVEVRGHQPFEVVGVGGLIVRESARGRGLGQGLMERIRPILTELGPDRAMLFCEPGLMPLYAPRGYLPLADPVWADQPTGPIRMPLPAMWRPVRPAEWPAGVIRVHGYPF